jgi:hypothetical protein
VFFTEYQSDGKSKEDKVQVTNGMHGDAEEIEKDFHGSSK